MQQRNLFVFFLICLVIILVWMPLQNWLWPPREKPKPPPRSSDGWVWHGKEAAVQAQVIGRLLGRAAPDGSGLAGAAQLATEANLAVHHPDLTPPDPWLWRRYRPENPVHSQVTTRLIGAAAPAGLGLDGALRLAAEVPLAVQFPLLHPEPHAKAKARSFSLGDESSFLKVQLTEDGAAVKSVVLNVFQAADRFGLPMWADVHKGIPLPLHLVPPNRIANLEENRITYDESMPFRHFLMYHYANPDDERPVDTLRGCRWVGREIRPGRQVQFVCDDLPDVTLTKTYTLEPGDYHIGLQVGVKRKTGTGGKLKFRYQLAGAHGLPIEGEWYTYVFRNAIVGWVDNSVPYRHLEDARQIGLWEGGEKLERTEQRVIRYGAVAIQFFTSAVVVDQKERQPTGKDNFIAWVRATREPPPEKRTIPYHEDITVRLVTEPIELEPQAEVVHQYLLYHGPVKVRLLGQMDGGKAVDPALVERYENTLGLHTLTDYPSPGFWGNVGSATGLSRLIIFFTNLMHGLLWVLHTYLLPFSWSYGLCIVLLTVIVRGLMFPISRRQAMNARDMQEKMGRLAPELKKLKEKYKDDFTQLTQAQQELYRRHGINPLASMGGCLLLFAQLPVFMGLYFCLQENIFLRLAPFLWVRNLAAPDMLAWWSENIPLISTVADQGSFLYLGPYLNLLPILAVALMIVQQKLMTPPPTDEQQEIQQKMMKYMMVVFGIMFYKVAAGLCIYFIASSLWGVAERKLLPKSKPTGPAPGDEEPAARTRPERKPEARSENGALKKLSGWWQDVLKEAGKQQQARRETGDDDRKRKRKRKRKGN